MNPQQVIYAGISKNIVTPDGLTATIDDFFLANVGIDEPIVALTLTGTAQVIITGNYLKSATTINVE